MIGRSVPSTVLVGALLTPLGGPAHRKTEAANEHYLAGELDLALAGYTEAQVAAPEAAELHYDIGNVLYRQADYAGAAEAFERALVSAGPGLQPRVAYNLGNAQFRQQEYSKAAESYRHALESVPGDADAKRNLELALRALEQQSRSKSEPQPSPPEQANEPKQNEPQDPQQGQGSPAPESSPGAGQGASPSPRPEPTAGGAAETSMTPEQAARLLDGAAEAERAARQQEAERAARAGDPAREKDW